METLTQFTCRCCGAIVVSPNGDSGCEHCRTGGIDYVGSRLSWNETPRSVTNASFEMPGEEKGFVFESEFTPLHAAVVDASMTELRYLLAQGADVNARMADGTTPLHAAFLHPDTAIVELLLEHGAELEARNSCGGTPLFYAALEGEYRLAALLIEKGANVNACDNNGATPLLLAVSMGHGEIVRLLLDHGADPNTTTDNHGRTPLHLAALRNQTRLIELLLAHGADAELEDKDGMTAEVLALCDGCEEAAAVLRKS